MAVASAINVWVWALFAVWVDNQTLCDCWFCGICVMSCMGYVCVLGYPV